MSRKSLLRSSLILVIGVILAIGPIAARQSLAAPLSYQDLKNMTFKGLSDIKGPVTLRNGFWKGAPAVKGGASRPRVDLIPTFIRHGDLNGDGKPDAIVLLSENFGGSGVYIFLAAVTRQGKTLENTGTAFLGDRSQVIDGGIHSGRITLTLLQAGPDDPSCCPGDIVTRTWIWTQHGLKEMKQAAKHTRLSLAFLNKTTWILKKWGESEKVPENIHITLRFSGTRLTGQCACNRYTVPVKDGELPGMITVTAPITATKKSCKPPFISAEKRYLKALRGVTNYGFYGGQLILSYTTKNGYGTLFFEKAETP